MPDIVLMEMETGFSYFAEQSLSALRLFTCTMGLASTPSGSMWGPESSQAPVMHGTHLPNCTSPSHLWGLVSSFIMVGQSRPNQGMMPTLQRGHAGSHLVLCGHTDVTLGCWVQGHC